MLEGSLLPWRNRRSDQRGQMLAMGAVTVTVVIAMGALAVDLGMALAARAAAQRAADSAALAGASAFLPNWPTKTAEDSAFARAYEYAEMNDVLGKAIEASQVEVWVLTDERKVRVRIIAPGLPAWFAKVFGVFSVDVGAIAAAEAAEGGITDNCVLPFAMPDLWDDRDNDDGDDIPNGDEDWEFDPLVDKYDGFTGSTGCLGSHCPYDGTGLGSNHRNHNENWEERFAGDVGRRIWIKAGPKGKKDDGSGGDAGGTDIMIGPGNFLIWEMPDISEDPTCQTGKPGANWVSENILECNECDIEVGLPYETQPGNIASIKDEMKELINQDPSASWDPINNVLTSDLGEASPRVRIVPLWNPNQALQGRSDYEFNNFAKIFIEGGGTEPPDFPIYARFMGVIEGSSGGATSGSLIKYLRLVE